MAGSWYGDTPRFELRPDGEGCVLRFGHVFDEHEKAARDAAGWESCFLRLGALLAGGPMSGVEALANWSEIHERYAERFGEDRMSAGKRLPSTRRSSNPAAQEVLGHDTHGDRVYDPRQPPDR